MLHIAHISDTHVLSTVGVERSEMPFNNRLTGYASLGLPQERVQRREYLHGGRRRLR